MPSTKFDPQTAKYKCCFGKLHVTTATEWICYIFFIVSILFTIFWTSREMEFSRDVFFMFVVLFALNAFIFGSGIYAVKKEQPKWLLPYVILVTIYSCFDAYDLVSDLVNKTYDGAWVLFDIFDLATNIWSIPIFYRCYQYLIEKKQNESLPVSFSNKNIENMPFALEENA